ncbi:MAG: iron ABC transporter permease [Planctomycetes bacterium]|nr:iron ABC transporter permease [Planctomycetota bacterium]
MGEGRRTRLLFVFALILACPVAFACSLAFGETVTFSLPELLNGGAGHGLDVVDARVFELRLGRALVATSVGAALALSGALLQGLFRNPLASPSVLGVTSGAALGASLALVVLGGLGPASLLRVASGMPLVFVPAAAFVGALAVTLVLLAIGSRGASSSMLLLCGIGLASLCGGLVQTVQSIVLSDWELSASITAWSFGSLDDRSRVHAVPVAVPVVLSLAAVPFVHRELDLLAYGEDDARALGVRARLLRIEVIVLSSLLAASAVAIAGQIAFIGLVVPNFVRLLLGGSHGRLLPITALSGGTLLLVVDLLQRTLLAATSLQPGALLSLVGAPVFLLLILLERRGQGPW